MQRLDVQKGGQLTERLKGRLQNSRPTLEMRKRKRLMMKTGFSGCLKGNFGENEPDAGGCSMQLVRGVLGIATSDDC